MTSRCVTVAGEPALLALHRIPSAWRSTDFVICYCWPPSAATLKSGFWGEVLVLPFRSLVVFSFACKSGCVLQTGPPLGE